MKRRKFFKPKPLVVPVSPPAQFLSNRPRMMFAENEFTSGEAVWEYELGRWICRRAGSGLSFLLKLDAASGKLELARRGFNWRWA